MNADRGQHPDAPRPRPGFIGMPPGMQTEIDTVAPAERSDAERGEADGAVAGDRQRASEGRIAAPSGDPAARPAASDSVTLVFDDGTPDAGLHGPVLLGRDPSRSDRFPQARPLALVDSGRSVSKTHVFVDVSGGGAWLVDLGSTNGTAVVDENGRETACVPGVPTAVPDRGGFVVGHVGVRLRGGRAESEEPHGAR